jgi:uncharacterized protein
MKPARPLTRIARTTAVTLVAGLGILSACQSRFIYFPNPYQPEQTKAFLETGGERIEFTTSQGRQTAWLQRPAGGAPPQRIWFVTAGNGSIALDLANLPGLAGLPELTDDAFVFVDYPGYGACEGKPHPKAIRESLKALGPVVIAKLQLTPEILTERGIVFGHSLGAAVALVAAEEYGIRRAVLLSPFTSTMDMTKTMFGVSLGFLVTHRFDNEASLSHLVDGGGEAWILHGTDDEVIPVQMGRQLAAGSKGKAHLTELPGTRHNTILREAGPAVAAAMAAAREKP